MTWWEILLSVSGGLVVLWVAFTLGFVFGMYSVIFGKE